MNKKTKILIVVILLFQTQRGVSQNSSKKIEFGLNISQYQKDFGIGMHIVSPYFLKSIAAFKVGANFQWFENYNGNEITWTPYQNLQIGLRGRHFIFEDKLSIYGEGGLLSIKTNSNFSTKSAIFGGYGLFGFEFKPKRTFGYFIELGGVGTGATADKLNNKPIFSNGFLTQVGFRASL